jgi:hypothetical protein
MTVGGATIKVSESKKANLEEISKALKLTA